jgi:hypothetical protein
VCERLVQERGEEDEEKKLCRVSDATSRLAAPSWRGQLVFF